jgi:hypothetical protein
MNTNTAKVGLCFFMKTKLILSIFLLVSFIININCSSLQYISQNFNQTKLKNTINLDTIFGNNIINNEILQPIIISTIEQISLQDKANISEIQTSLNKLVNLYNKYVFNDSYKIKKITLTEKNKTITIEFRKLKPIIIASSNRLNRLVSVINYFISLFKKTLLSNLVKIFEIKNPEIRKKILRNLTQENSIDQKSLKQIGFSKLHFAVYTGDTKTVSKLIQDGADINEKVTDKNTFGLAGFSPIHLAVYFNHKDIVKLLIEKNCNIISMTPAGDTALMIAKNMGYFNLIPMLMEYEDTKRYNHSVSQKELDVSSTALKLINSEKYEEAKKLLKETNAAHINHPQDLLDPSTGELIGNPVFTRSGLIYDEQNSITEFKLNETEPFTQNPRDKFNNDYVIEEILTKYHQTALPVFIIELLDKRDYTSIDDLLTKYLQRATIPIIFGKLMALTYKKDFASARNLLITYLKGFTNRAMLDEMNNKFDMEIINLLNRFLEKLEKTNPDIAEYIELKKLMDEKDDISARNLLITYLKELKEKKSTNYSMLESMLDEMNNKFDMEIINLLNRFLEKLEKTNPDIAKYIELKKLMDEKDDISARNLLITYLKELKEKKSTNYSMLGSMLDELNNKLNTESINLLNGFLEKTTPNTAEYIELEKLINEKDCIALRTYLKGISNPAVFFKLIEFLDKQNYESFKNLLMECLKKTITPSEFGTAIELLDKKEYASAKNLLIEYLKKINTTPMVFDKIIRLLDKRDYTSAENLLIEHLSNYSDKIMDNPDYFICPFSGNVMETALTLSDERSYEKKEILEYNSNFKEGFLSPLNHTPVHCNNFTTNHTLTSMIDFYRIKTIFQCIKYAQILINIDAKKHKNKINQLIKRAEEFSIDYIDKDDFPELETEIYNSIVQVLQKQNYITEYGEINFNKKYESALPKDFLRSYGLGLHTEQRLAIYNFLKTKYAFLQMINSKIEELNKEISKAEKEYKEKSIKEQEPSILKKPSVSIAKKTNLTNISETISKNKIQTICHVIIYSVISKVAIYFLFIPRNPMNSSVIIINLTQLRSIKHSD